MKPCGIFSICELDRHFTMEEIVRNTMKMKNKCPSYDGIAVEMWKRNGNSGTHMKVDQNIRLQHT
jgi:hypothetical protein